MPTTLSDRLRVLIDRSGMSLAAVAALAGMDRQQLWQIVQGNTPDPRIFTVQRIVEATGATMTEFFSEEEDNPIIPAPPKNTLKKSEEL